MAERIIIRRGTASEWAAADPILAEGELGVDTSVDQLKVGDGVTHWSGLTFLSAGEVGPGGGSVDTVNGQSPDGSGAVTVTAGQIPETATAKVMTATERTRLAGMADQATKNATDAALRDRTTHTGKTHAYVALDDLDTSGGVAGQVIRKGVDGVGRWSTSDNPAASPVATTDLTDVDATVTPVDGNLLVRRTGAYTPAAGALPVYVRNAGQPLTSGDLPGLYVDRAATSLLRQHVFEGTAGQAVSFAAMNYSGYTGAARTWTSEQAMVGATSVLIAGGSLGYFYDSGLALDVAVMKGRIRFKGAPTGTVNFAEMQNTTDTGGGLAALQRDPSTGFVKVKDGAGNTRATSTFAVNPDTWYTFEWKVGGANQTLRFYDASGAQLGADIPASATAGVVNIINYGIRLNGGNHTGLFLEDSALATDWIGAAA